jgi:dipeptidase E
MKLLLTSNGLSNPSIAKAFAELIGKEPKDSKVAFIPTAANYNRGLKDWLINDLHRILEAGYYVDIFELSALSKASLQEGFKDMDAIFVGGGNTFYLSYWMEKSGLNDLLKDMLKTKVYAGISAGSIITGQSLVMTSEAMKNPKAFEDKDYYELSPDGEASTETLKLVDFIFRPHLNNPGFPLVRKDILEERAKTIKFPIYALDDNSALKIVDGQIDIVSEGEWLVLNK